MANSSTKFSAAAIAELYLSLDPSRLPLIDQLILPDLSTTRTTAASADVGICSRFSAVVTSRVTLNTFSVSVPVMLLLISTSPSSRVSDDVISTLDLVICCELPVSPSANALAGTIVAIIMIVINNAQNFLLINSSSS